MSQPSSRVLRLRYRAKCAVCFRVLEPGTRAEWNSTRKLAICLPCTKARPKTGLLSSVAGGSARSQAERRRAKQQARLHAEREARPVLGRIRQGLFPETDAGVEWEKGAVGEEQLAASMNTLVEDGTIAALHDRRIPRSTANIDHLVVAASGIWVIDAKRYKGRISKDVRGGFFSSRAVVTVNGRDRTKLVEGVEKQIGVVQSALTESGIDAVPVHGALCFVDGDWGLRFRPFTVDGVLITWPKALRDHLRASGALDADQRGQLIDALAVALPPAS
jgi:hypothetical protein